MKIIDITGLEPGIQEIIGTYKDTAAWYGLLYSKGSELLDITVSTASYHRIGFTIRLIGETRLKGTEETIAVTKDNITHILLYDVPVEGYIPPMEIDYNFFCDEGEIAGRTDIQVYSLFEAIHLIKSWSDNDFRAISNKGLGTLNSTEDIDIEIIKL